jgi:Trk K+ transport system NAD-binding subunit
VDRPVVLCGLGRVGWRILDHLRAAGVPVAVVSLSRPDDPRLADVPFVAGDCRRPDVLDQAGVKHARGVVIVTSDDLVNVSTALLVRQLNPDCRVVVRMFNQGLIPRLGAAVKNTVALSVSALTAPLLALTALTGDSLGAFRLDDKPQQVAEVRVEEGSDLAGLRLADVAGRFKLLILSHTPAGGSPKLWHAVAGDTPLSVGDSFVACGSPAAMAPLLSSGRGDLLAGVQWAGWVRRQLRTLRRALAAVDLSVKLATAGLFVTLFASTLVFRYALHATWVDGLYQTVGITATGADLPRQYDQPWAKAFVSALKIAGAALVAAFTAILTQYLIRARLGGAFEARRIPDGGHVLVCGLGNVGFRCVEELRRMGAQVVAVERVNDNPFAATVRRMGVPVVIGDAVVIEVLRQARADAARAVIAATDSELANLEIALLVRELNPAQRVVVRLADAAFAQAVRAAADIKFAVSIPALAAPAFAAALLGDRVQTLLATAGRTLAVVDLVVQPDDPCLFERPLAAAEIDYRFLPVALGGKPPFAEAGLPAGHRLAAGERLTVVTELPDLNRLLRREPVPADRAVVVESYPLSAAELLAPIVRTNRGCSQAEAEAAVRDVPFTLATNLTRGDAEVLLARLSRDKVSGRLVPSDG